MRKLPYAQTCAFATLLLLAASSCGGGRNDGGPVSAVRKTPSVTQSQTNAMPRDRVQDGGKFTWPLDSWPANFNYNQLDGTAQDGEYLLSAMNADSARVRLAAGLPNVLRDIASTPYTLPPR